MKDTYEIIDIDKNSIIEASAGTGKTTTIVNLVVRILLEKKADISEIVAVTFTEKATGELKEKIRKTLIEKLDQDKENKIQYNKINGFLENFDCLLINTIHGFCNRLLNEYAFENNEPFQKEIVDDTLLYPKILHAQMRKDWLTIYGENLEKILSLSDFENNPFYFENLCIDIAKKYKPELGDRLIPEPLLDQEKIKNNIFEFENEINELLKLISIDSDNNIIQNNKLYKEYEGLNKILNARSIETRLNKIIKPLIQFKIECNNNPNKISAFKIFYIISSECSGFDTKKENLDYLGYTVLFYGTIKKGNENYDFVNNNKDIYNIINILEKLRINFTKLSKLLLSNTIYLLINGLREYKRENALISYDDMLYLLYKSLEKKDFLDIIQKRFKYALVDEFQDTDRIQWNIFKKIFLENSKNRLFIIGDPKQAIYGFRNADVFTYLKAKDEMKNNYNAKYYPLNTNWRSTEKLINDYNKIFNEKEWFNNKDSNENKIEYKPVVIPENKKIQSKMIFFDTDNKRNLSGINLFKIENANKEDTLYQQSQYIINEIKYLLDNKNIKLKIKEEEPRSIKENDISIIVKTKREAEIIERYLSLNRLKSTFYKKAGLYQSNEAVQLKHLLKAVAYREDRSLFKKALLTNFFNIDIKELNKYREFEENSRFNLLFEKWIILAEKRKWSKLFNSLLYNTGLFYRLVYNENELNINSDRIITNYRHISENLEYTAIKNRYDIYDLVLYLTNLINKALISEVDEDLHRLETEEDKIKIMTIHASKGLEFPIVFLFHAFTKSDTNDYLKFHDTNSNNIIFDLLKHEENQMKHTYEEEEELKRIFYVAFTRASLKLYIPYLNNTDNKNLETIAGVIKSSIDKNFINNDNKYFLSIEEFNDKKIITVDNNQITFSKPEIKIIEPLFPVINKNEFEKRKITVQSFSGLHNKISLKIQDEFSASDFGEEKKEIDEPLLEKESLIEEENILPGGSFIGEMFHKILENIDFDKVNLIKNKIYNEILNDDEIKNLIERNFNIYLLRNTYTNDDEKKDIYFNKTLEIIYNTLNSPINEENLILSNIQKANKIHEVEFYLPVENKNRKSDIFLNGFIDMVFRDNKRYYLLDWKSNYLKSGYEGNIFIEEVKRHYELQYQIYLTAFIEWLKNKSSNFKYERDFGGIYYIYLRGINIKNKKNKNGVFYFRPDENEFKSIRTNLFNNILERAK